MNTLCIVGIVIFLIYFGVYLRLRWIVCKIVFEVTDAVLEKADIQFYSYNKSPEIFLLFEKPGEKSRRIRYIQYCYIFPGTLDDNFFNRTISAPNYQPISIDHLFLNLKIESLLLLLFAPMTAITDITLFMMRRSTWLFFGTFDKLARSKFFGA